ncbi:MAG: tRNA adenosine(34) deaminase TadA, partial [Oscillospiraceae bacterium]|nr:tRNA adenosine(34) deaminase TadA [Oscillospiraceae bacterium]
MTEQDILFMTLALDEAKKASDIGEVPVGTVIVRDGEVVACAYNRRECDKNALSHAEVLAISKACEKLGGWRLHQCELYVTLEPCPMCTGAIINSRIKRVVFGASDKKAGCMGSIVNLTEYPFNHKPEIVGGVLADESAQLLSDFFK